MLSLFLLLFYSLYILFLKRKKKNINNWFFEWKSIDSFDKIDKKNLDSDNFFIWIEFFINRRIFQFFFLNSFLFIYHIRAIEFLSFHYKFFFFLFFISDIFIFSFSFFFFFALQAEQCRPFIHPVRCKFFSFYSQPFFLLLNTANNFSHPVHIFVVSIFIIFFFHLFFWFLFLIFCEIKI